MATTFEQSTRGILTLGTATMHKMTINKLPKFESVKIKIRNYKCKNVECSGNPTCAAEIVILDKYKSTLKGDPFLLFDSGIGDEQRITVYGTPKFVSLLCTSDNW